MLLRSNVTWSMQISRARTRTQSGKCQHSRETFNFVLNSEGKKMQIFILPNEA